MRTTWIRFRNFLSMQEAFNSWEGYPLKKVLNKNQPRLSEGGGCSLDFLQLAASKLALELRLFKNYWKLQATIESCDRTAALIAELAELRTPARAPPKSRQSRVPESEGNSRFRPSSSSGEKGSLSALSHTRCKWSRCRSQFVNLRNGYTFKRSGTFQKISASGSPCSASGSHCFRPKCFTDKSEIFRGGALKKLERIFCA